MLMLLVSACSAQSAPSRNRQPPVPTGTAIAGRANLTPTPLPFATKRLARFDQPFAIAMLPNGAALITEKAGRLKLRWADGNIVDVAGVPAVVHSGQGGLLDVAIAPDFAASHQIYLSYAERGPGGSALALARATLDIRQVQCIRAPSPAQAALGGLRVIWRSGSNGRGGQFGANILFAPDGKSLFLSSGERQRFTPAQDPDQALGKVLRLTLDGKAWPGNPDYKAGGVRAMTWSTGHRNPYGMVFTADGRLWEEEMGPLGGDELNLVLPGRNYGWPIVSNGDHYSGKPIPDHPTRPDLEAPKLWWNPSISPGGMIVYTGAMFPEWRGHLLIAALGGEALIRVIPSGATARVAAQWATGARIRDVAQASDGAIWLLEDGGDLVRLSPR